MALSNAFRLSDFSSGIGTQGAALKVDNTNNRIGIGTTNPQATLQVGLGVTIDGTAGFITATGIKLDTADVVVFTDVVSTGVATAPTFKGNIVGTAATFTTGTFIGNVSVGGTLTYDDVTNIDSIGIVTARTGIKVLAGGISATGVVTATSFAGIGTVAITNNADNRVITGSSAVGGLNGEVNLTFDGNNLKLNDDKKITFGDNLRMEMYTDGYTNYIKSEGDRPLKFYISSTERLGITSTGQVQLSAISDTISDTAVDVFVYDTRKDSDGGAWRKRTQDTSWYIETLNTATRGSRKEFPAVAVIVAEATKVTIYDGDDPDLPMWMVFNQTGGSDGQNRMLNRFMGNMKKISMLNGNLVVCANSTSSADRGGGVWINFISEFGYAFGTNDSQGENIYGTLLHNIAQRNTILGTDIYADKIQKYQLVDNSQCNDVAMTVLPNAPIDSATGLPIPTIAVATDGGVSVIKDDGTVVQKALTDAGTDIPKVEFTNDGFLIMNRNNYHYFVVNPIDAAESADHPSGFVNNINYFRNNDNFPGPLSPDGAIGGYGNQGIVKSIKGTDIAMADPYGLNIFNVTRGIPSTSNMVAYVTSDYNTGYMHGDIKGAFLSDTYTDADFGSEMVTGGDFSNAGDWSFSATPSWSINGSGQLVNGGAADSVLQAGSFTQGKYYQLTADLVSGTASSFGVTAHHDTSVEQPHNQLSYMDVYCVGNVGGKIYAMWKQSGANLNSINLYANAAITIDNVSIKEISRFYYDRSVNNKPLALIGSLTRTPVATGAELVAYSGFSASNYLQSPPGSISIEQNDFCVSFWYKRFTGDDISVFFDFIDGTANGFRVVPGNGSNDIYLVNGNFSSYVAFAGTARPNKWTHTTVVRNYGTDIRVYQDGDLVGTTGTFSSTNYNAGGVIKVGGGGSTAASTSISLLRISTTAPSPEQIKKMYDDEKVLFQENAKCTLYGSSDAVTALAFDDTTNLLHAGTSGGRSTFSGLKRIENTTTAVTTAISASNGLVAEQ